MGWALGIARPPVPLSRGARPRVAGQVKERRGGSRRRHRMDQVAMNQVARARPSGRGLEGSGTVLRSARGARSRAWRKGAMKRRSIAIRSSIGGGASGMDGMRVPRGTACNASRVSACGATRTTSVPAWRTQVACTTAPSGPTDSRKRNARHSSGAVRSMTRAPARSSLPSRTTAAPRGSERRIRPIAPASWARTSPTSARASAGGERFDPALDGERARRPASARRPARAHFELAKNSQAAFVFDADDADRHVARSCSGVGRARAARASSTRSRGSRARSARPKRRDANHPWSGVARSHSDRRRSTRRPASRGRPRRRRSRALARRPTRATPHHPPRDRQRRSAPAKIASGTANHSARSSHTCARTGPSTADAPQRPSLQVRNGFAAGARLARRSLARPGDFQRTTSSRRA